MTGFVDIVELLGIVPDEVDMDGGDGVVQVIHDHKRRLLMFYEKISASTDGGPRSRVCAC